MGPTDPTRNVMSSSCALGSCFAPVRNPVPLPVGSYQNQHIYFFVYKASRVASARLKPFAYDCFRQERVPTKKPELRIAGAKPLWS